MEIPKWLQRSLRNDDLDAIKQAIGRAESKTSGEIVPMVVHSSAGFGHVLPLLLANGLVLFLIIQNLGLNFSSLGVPPAWLQALLGLGIFGACFILARFDAVGRLLTSGEDLEKAVWNRAEVEFYEAGLHKTIESTGVLVFVSLKEHQVVVLADKSIADKLPQETWLDVDRIVVEGAKKQQLGKGLQDAIDKCGELLAVHFPVKKGDQNELRDRLIIKK